MHKILWTLALPFLLFAQEPQGTSHGYMILDNGQVYTSRGYFPKPGYVDMFKPDGYFILPERVEATGSNFVVANDDTLYTAHYDGWFFKDMEYLRGKSVSKVGGSFFVTTDGGGHIVKTDGSVVEHQANGFDLFKTARILGGVYFITPSDELYIANPYDGKFYKGDGTFDGDARDVEVVGDNYFIMESGELYTIGFVNGSAIVNKAKKSSLFTNVKTAGGNYFFDRKNQIHTVAATGVFDGGMKNRELTVKADSLGKDRSEEIPEHTGSNYFVYEDGEVWMVDSSGVFYYLKTLPYYERVGRTNSIKED